MYALPNYNESRSENHKEECPMKKGFWGGVLQYRTLHWCYCLLWYFSLFLLIYR